MHAKARIGPRVVAADLKGIPWHLAGYFDLRGRGVVTDQDVQDVVDYFDRIAPGNRNGVIDGPEVLAVERFVAGGRDVREINAANAQRIAGELKTAVLAWTTDTKVDYVRIARALDRADGRYQDFAKDEALRTEVAFLVGNLIWASSLAIMINIAAVLVPFGVVAAAQRLNKKSVMQRKELAEKLEEFHELQTENKLAFVEEIRDALLAKIDEAAGSPELLRELTQELEKKLKRPRVLKDEDLYRSILLSHARIRKNQITGSKKNLQRTGKYYTSTDGWNPLRLNGRKIAKELNRLSPEGRRKVHLT